MAEQTPNDELEVLRRTNSELVAKNTTRKAKIAELEASVVDLQTKLTDATTSLRTVTIDGPLKKMSESISTAPELWIEQFNKSYRLELVKGELTLVSVADSKPVLKEGKAVPFERETLMDLLTKGDDAQAKTFRAITITSHASGGAASPQRKTAPIKQKKPAVQFGLR